MDVSPRSTPVVDCALLLGLSFLILPALHADDVLLNLPREFDVTARRPAWDNAPGDVPRPPPLVFRFRGEAFRATRHWTYGIPGRDDISNLLEEELEGTFRRGRLEGTYEFFDQNSLLKAPSRHPSCPPAPIGPYHKNWESGRVEGTATSDGLLSLTLHVTSHRNISRREEYVGGQYGCYRDLGWVDTTRESETQWAQKWTPHTETIILRLPVGELQSSQKLSTPPRTQERPDAGGTSDAAVGSVRGRNGDAGGEGAAGVAGTGPEAGGPNAGDTHDSPWSVPVSPGAAAGAGAAVALTSLLGALWMFASSGLSPGDLLGAAPEADAPEPPSGEASSPRELSAERPRDGEVNPDTGEVWSENVGGWVGSNYHAIERRAQAEVRRAQGVSDRESRRESERIAEELRASRKREAEAARRGAQAAEESVWLEAPTIEPYQPGWTDYITKGLEWAELGTDTSMSVLGALTGPGGEKGARIYTVAKETVKGLSQGVADWNRGEGGHLAGEGSLWVIVERGTIGLTKGAAKVGLDKVTGDMLDGVGAKMAETSAVQGGKAVVKTVVDQLDSPAGVETCRSVGMAVGKTLLGSEMVAPVNAGIESATGEKM